jgi:hypothetical protein
MKARMFSWFVPIAIAALILILACQGIVSHLRVPRPMTNTDQYLADIAARDTLWVYVRGAIGADMAIFWHSPLRIVFWLATSALFWGVLVIRRGPGNGSRSG